MTAVLPSQDSAANPSGQGAPLAGVSWWARLLRVAILMASDLTALLACSATAYLVWARTFLHQSASIYLPLLPLVLLFPLAYGTGDLYPGFGIGAVQTLRRLILRTSFVMLALISFTFALKVPARYSRVTVALTWLGALVAVPLVRYLVLNVARRWRWWTEPAILVGRGEKVAALRETLNAALSLGYRPIAVLYPEGQATATAGVGSSLEESFGELRDASSYAMRGVRVAFVVDQTPASEASLLDSLQEHFRHVILVHSMASLPVESVVVRDLGGLLGLELTNQLLMRRNRLTKRALDVVLGFVALSLALPIIGLAALAIKLVDGGPVIYRQEREGLGGSSIQVRKLRTMYRDAQERLEEHLSASMEARKEWRRSFKLENDPRIIPGIGRFLRRFSIDELPQLWNVFKGEMSLVGPRPFPEYHLRKFSPGFLALRRRVRPGMTGLWQVMIRSEGSIEEQEAFDTHYIRNWSIWMDLYILAKTTAAVLSGRGAR